MRKASPGLAAVALLAVVAMVGCGGGGDSGSTNTAANENANSGSASSGEGNGTSGAGNGGGENEGKAAKPTAEGPGSSAGSQAFVRQADAICTAARQKAIAGISKISSTFYPGGKADPQKARESEVNLMVPLLVRTVESEVSQIRQLDIPASKQSEVEALLASFESWTREARADPQKMVNTNDVYNEPRTKANSIGLFACAQSPFQR